MYAVRLTIVVNMTLPELLRVFSSHLACAHGRFKWRSFGAGEKIQTNRDVAWFWAGQQERHAKTCPFRLDIVVSTSSNDSLTCALYLATLYNYFKLQLRAVDRISLICAHLIICRVLHIIYSSSKMTRMT